MSVLRKDEAFLSAVGHERLSARQVDELIGLARGIACDGAVNQGEAEFLQRWLAANIGISNHPLIATLYQRVNEVLADGILDSEEAADLLATLNALSDRDFELGEVLKATTLPLCVPAPAPLRFDGMSYCFTGTFNFGSRADCERAVSERGGECGSLRKSTAFLVIGLYATESWKHSSFGNKIMKAVEMRSEGVPIAIVSEAHWAGYLD
jgi:NAD-dependent DNA ligase